MPSIPVGICRFSDNNFQRLYLNKETHFVHFWLTLTPDDISEMCMKFKTFWKEKKSILA